MSYHNQPTPIHQPHFALVGEGGVEADEAVLAGEGELLDCFRCNFWVERDVEGCLEEAARDAQELVRLDFPHLFNC